MKMRLFKHEFGVINLYAVTHWKKNPYTIWVHFSGNNDMVELTGDWVKRFEREMGEEDGYYKP